MPKTANKTREAFAWDEERSLGFVYPEEGARKCLEVKRAKKDEKDYVVLTEWRYYAKKNEDGSPGEEQWNPVKGFTIPAHNFDEINDLIQADFLTDPAAEPTNGEDE